MGYIESQVHRQAADLEDHDVRLLRLERWRKFEREDQGGRPGEPLVATRTPLSLSKNEIAIYLFVGGLSTLGILAACAALWF